MSRHRKRGGRTKAATEILHAFPGLASVGWQITSPASKVYNCIAWAAGVSDRWMFYDAAWPPSVPRSAHIDAYQRVFESNGYTVCGDESHEDGVEKVALYGDASGRCTHAARQLKTGYWTSKLGKQKDIRHKSLSGLVGVLYGTVQVVLERPRPAQTKS